jgi:hypothetical protein
VGVVRASSILLSAKAHSSGSMKAENSGSCSALGAAAWPAAFLLVLTSAGPAERCRCMCVLLHDVFMLSLLTLRLAGTCRVVPAAALLG